MRKKSFFIAGMIVLSLGLIGMGYGWYLFHKPHAGVTGVAAAARLSSVDLYNKFEQNETSADKLYVGQVLEVEGKVSDVEKTDSTLSLVLEGGAGGGVNCSVAGAPGGKTGTGGNGSDSQPPVPAKGAVVTVKGRCTGFLMDVNMVDCVIEQIKQ